MAALITTGLVLFNGKMEGLEVDNVVGIALIVGSLLFDGLVSSQTDKEHKKSGRDFAYSMMFSNNFVQLLFNLMFYAFYYFVHGDDTLPHLLSEPVLLRDVILIGASGAVGQIFLYLAISLFGSYKLSVITTSRKLFSVILSNFSFHHHFTSRQWLGAVLVMSCTVAELFFGKKEKKEEQTTADPVEG
jgi:UDP-galactose transporter B1